MKSNRVLSLILLASTLFAACSSTTTRTSVEGYNDAALNRKRVFLLLPTGSEITFTNADQFGSSRGVAGASAAETFEGELRTVLVTALQDRLDSNTILNYAEQSAAGIVPLSATTDFNAEGPIAWETIRRARQEAAMDYLVVLRDVTVRNTAGSDARGSEAVTATYMLIDPGAKKVMSKGTVSVDVGAPRTPAMTHEQLAAELTGNLPFTIVK
jgi:hypothetical protein